MESINDLIRELIKIRDKHGNVAIKNNEIELSVIGVSYKYLLIKSEILTTKPMDREEPDGKILHTSEGSIQDNTGK